MFGVSFIVVSETVLLCSPGWPFSSYVARTGLELTILLLQPPECWDYRHAPLGSFPLNWIMLSLDQFIHSYWNKKSWRKDIFRFAFPRGHCDRESM
jgi:hypothetical protein